MDLVLEKKYHYYCSHHQYQTSPLSVDIPLKGSRSGLLTYCVRSKSASGLRLDTRDTDSCTIGRALIQIQGQI
jgi:hypothetical protein